MSGAFLSRAKGDQISAAFILHRLLLGGHLCLLPLVGSGWVVVELQICLGVCALAWRWRLKGGLAFGVFFAVNRGRRFSSPADLEDDGRADFPGGEGLRCDYAVELFPARKLVRSVAGFYAGGFDAGWAALRGMPLLAFWRSSAELAGCLGGGSLVARLNQVLSVGRVKPVVSAGDHSVNAFCWDPAKL
ncbi:hypothetical protein QQ045_004752 [Rhodiola kirilowii]